MEHCAIASKGARRSLIGLVALSLLQQALVSGAASAACSEGREELSMLQHSQAMPLSGKSGGRGASLKGKQITLNATQTAEFAKYYDRNLTAMWGKRNQVQTWSLQVETTIEQDAKTVFEAVATPNLWPICYPNTLSVGGLGHKPMDPETPAGMLLEKFQWAGELYSLFRYQVADYVPWEFLTFDGALIFTAFDMVGGGNLTQEMVDSILGRFQYNISEVAPNRTRWIRTVYFYPTDASPVTAAAFNAAMRFVFPYQEKGAPMYVDCVKRFMATPSWKSELYHDSN